MFGNLRLWCRQYGGAIRYFRKMVRLLLHSFCAIKGSFFIIKIYALLCTTVLYNFAQQKGE